MSAQTNARQSFSVIKTPWWDASAESVKDRHPLTIAEAREWAGLTWEPVVEPVYAAMPGFDSNNAPRMTYTAVDGFQRVARSDSSSTTLGVTSDRWEAIDNSAAFELATHMLVPAAFATDDLVIEATTKLVDLGVQIETAGYLREGDTTWVCGILDQPRTLPGDFSPTQSYIVVTCNHAGNGALKAIETYVRAVCANTLHAGDMDAEARGTAFSFRHGPSWREQLDAAKAVVMSARNNFDRLADLYEELSAVTVDETLTTDFIATLVPLDPRATPRAAGNVDRDRTVIRKIIASDTVKPVEGSALGLWLAAGEFADHGRRYRSRDTYITRTLLTPNAIKSISLNVLEDLTDRTFASRQLVSS